MSLSGQFLSTNVCKRKIASTPAHNSLILCSSNYSERVCVIKNKIAKAGLMLLTLCLFNIAHAQISQNDRDLSHFQAQIESARASGDMDLADSLASQFLSLATQSNLTQFEADALYQQARNDMERNLYAPSQERLNRAIELYQELDDQKKLGNAYRQLGLTYRYQANYSVALEYIYLSMQIFQQLDDKDAISSAHNSIGVVLEKMGQFEEASQAHQAALELNHELQDQGGIASALFNLGDLRRSMGDNELALKYFQDALKLDIAGGELKNIAYSHHKIGFVHNSMGNTEQARFHIMEALKLFRQIQTPRDTDWALTSLAQLEMDEGNYAEAQSIIEGVINRAIENQYNSLLVDAYKVAAELAFRLEQYNASLELIDVGLEQAKRNKERADEALLEELRVQVHLKNDSIKEAFEALQRQKRIDDEILNAKRLDSIANVQAQSEFVRRAHQIELLEKESALQRATIQQESLTRKLWLVAISAGVILMFMLYGRIVQRKVNLQLGEQVALRTQELELKNHQLQLAYQEMEEISLTDKLTNIHNRRFLDNHIDADLDQCHRVYQDWRKGKTSQPSQSDIVVFMIDMDNFKEVNDRYGHASGDLVLQQLSERMAKVFRHSDYLVRWGGEEFVAVARFIEREDAPLLAQRMLNSVNEMPFELTGGVLSNQTCSIGFACYPPVTKSNHRVEWQRFVSVVDACLYAAKHSGKNSWVGVYSISDSMLLEDADISLNKLINWSVKGLAVLQSSHGDIEKLRRTQIK